MPSFRAQGQGSEKWACLQVRHRPAGDGGSKSLHSGVANLVFIEIELLHIIAHQTKHLG